jgi:hypothetical protein
LYRRETPEAQKNFSAFNRNNSPAQGVKIFSKSVFVFFGASVPQWQTTCRRQSKKFDLISVIKKPS